MNNIRKLNAFMSLLPGSLGSALVSALAGNQYGRGGPLPRPKGYTKNVMNKIMNAKVPRIGGRRRFGYGNREYSGRTNGGIEINRAEGGFKRLTDGLTYVTRSFDEIMQFGIKPSSSLSRYGVGTNLINQVDLVSQLMENEEFLTYNLMIVKYKLIGIRITVDYCSVPVAQTVLNKMVLVPTTDLLKDIQGQINKCSMKLDMSHPGVKNFNFNINRRNMNEDSCEWIQRSQTYPGTLQISITQVIDNSNPLNSNQILGSFKISWIVKMALQDVAGTLRKAFGLNKVKLKDKINELKNGLLPPANLLPIPKEDDKIDDSDSVMGDKQNLEESIYTNSDNQ